MQNGITLDTYSTQENESNYSQNEQSERNTFRHGLTIDNETSRQIDLDHILQGLDNQFEREFTYYLSENTNRLDPIQERNATIDIYLYKDSKFNKRYNKRNSDDMNYLNQTGFKFPINFNNNSGEILPFQKICHAIQQVINEDITSNEGLYPIHYLTGNGVKLHEARNINILVNYRQIMSVFRNKHKKKRLDVFVNNPDLTLTPKSTTRVFVTESRGGREEST